MESREAEIMSSIGYNNKIDPSEFDISIITLLIGVGGEKYIDNFRKHNIGQCTLMEMTDKDLIKLGIDEAEVRTKIMEGVKILPLNEEVPVQSAVEKLRKMDATEIAHILEESSQHLYRIYLSMMANTLAVKKATKKSDCLVHKDKYASDISISTLSEITNILNSMDIVVHTQMKSFTKESRRSKHKKLVIGGIGSCVIAVLAVFFVRSLRQLK